MTAKLDPRPVRTDLTSREVAKILGASLGPLLAAEIGQTKPVASASATRRGLQLTLALIEGEHGAIALPSVLAQEKDPIALAAMSHIGGVVMGLREMAPAESIRVALLWWDTDRAWDALGTELAEQAARYLALKSEGGG